jgi:FG-GAP-like repeat
MRLALAALFFASAAFAQLQPGVIVTNGAPFPVVADFNGDGLDDLVQNRSVLINTGSGFVEEQYAGYNGPAVIGVLDVNGDGVLDLLSEAEVAGAPVGAGGPNTAPARYYLHIGTQSRTYPHAKLVSTGARPYVADVDDDGKDDFLVMTYIRPAGGGRTVAMEVTVMRSRGDGTFEHLQPFRMPPDPQIAPDYRVLSGDLNHDGKTDLVIRCAEDLVVLRGTGGGRFAVESRYLPLTSSYRAHSARLADIDGDSHLDVVLPGQRLIRVFFGDGRGNFPRTAFAAIEKLHAADIPSGVPGDPDQFNQPRNLAVGRFTRSDQWQIAAGTGEGDLVIFAYENATLKEVARTRTEFWSLDIRSGHFRNGAATDLYVGGTLIWGPMYPRPRVYYSPEVTASAAAAARTPSRSRVSGRSNRETAMHVEAQGDCVEMPLAQWTFTHEGLFASAQAGDTRVEAVFDAPLLSLRVHTSSSAEPAYALLIDRGNGVYSGTMRVMTSCGTRLAAVTARVQ